MLSGKHGVDTMASDMQTERLWSRLAAIHQRVQWMADEEARSAWVNGPAAQGMYLDEKERLIDEAERVLDALEAIHT
ncbi:hypothetical protein MTBSS4_130002 [Magnetospirillum sp. SS-4]|nr:hypothetical protein MTBSS4_130002 [Magnetospirillum sp. SS-4]